MSGPDRSGTSPVPRPPPSFRSVPTKTRWGLAGCVLLYLATATIHASTLPWTGSLDSKYHLDYVYSLYHGELPEPVSTSRYQHPDVSGRFAEPSPQYARNHPPGFYAVLAPIVGPALEADRYAVGVALGRGVNIAIGAVAILLLGWIGWLVGGARRGLLAIVLPAVSGVVTPLVRLGGDIYNDLAVTTVSLATLGMGIVVLQRGLTVRRVVLLSALAAIGLSIKATFIFTIVVAAVAVLFAGVLHERDLRSAFRVSMRAGSALVLVPVVAIGWFYYWNHELSGSWVSAIPDENRQSRSVRTLADVLGSSDFWLIVPSDTLGGTGWSLGGFGSTSASRALILGSLVALVALAIVTLLKGRGRQLPSRVSIVVALVLVGHLALLYLAQLEHAVGSGQYAMRYFVPAIATIGLIPALLLVRLGRALPVALSAVLIVEVASSILDARSYAERRWPDAVAGRELIDQFQTLAMRNGLPAAIPAIAVVTAVVAICFIAWCLRSIDAHSVDAFGAAGLDPRVQVDRRKYSSEAARNDASETSPVRSRAFAQ